MKYSGKKTVSGTETGYSFFIRWQKKQHDPEYVPFRAEKRLEIEL